MEFNKEFNNIGLVLTDYCNAHCEMCCSSQDDLTTEKRTLSKQELTLFLDQVRDCDEITAIGITGGEPMLYQDLVQQVCDYDFGRKVKLSIKTNGFWGSKKNKAEDFISRNSSSISHISFSYDEFHRRYVSLDSIKNIIDIATSYSITTDIVGCFFADSVKPGDILNELGDYAYKTRFEYQPVFRTGLAVNFYETSFVHLYEVGKDKLPCTAPLRQSLLVTSDLDFYPCCSQIVQNTILKIGNLRERSLSNLLSDMKHNKLLVKIFTEGLEGILASADQQGECPKNLSVPCEACEYLFRDNRFLGRINELLKSEN